MKTCRLAIAVAAIVACVFTGQGMAQGPWHVATNGVDDAGRDGLSWPAAWATIGYAVGRATAGGTIFVSNGVYTLSGQILVDKALTIESVNGREVTIVDGNGVDRCFKLHADNTVLRGLTITNGFRDTSATDPDAWFRDGGGGVQITRNAITLDHCRILNNTSLFWGGGVYIGADKDGGGGAGTVITNCVIRGNRGMVGGGIRLWAGGVAAHSLTLVDSDVRQNEAIGTLHTDSSKHTAPGGAGIWFQGANLTVRNSIISDNTIGENPMPGTSSRGAGIHVMTPNVWTLIENCEITGNISSNARGTWGGGVSLAGSSNTVRNCLIADNRIVIAGGGGVSLRGGGIYIQTPNATNMIESCTLAGNAAWAWTAVTGGSAVHQEGDGSDVIRNCVVYSNSLLEGLWKGGPEWYFGNTARTSSLYYTCWTGTTGNAGCITNDPQFVSVAGENYRLRNTSPCLNVATNVAWMASALDLDGNPRIDRTLNQPDMGAYEYAYEGTSILIR